MDRRTFIAATAGFMASTGTALADSRTVNSPGDGYLNLRTGPGTKYSIIRRMYHGSSVEVLEYAGAWLRVRHQSGAVGWAYAKYLTRAASRWRSVYSPNDGYLNLRTGPGTKYKIIFAMYNGEQVEVLEKRGNWWRVRHEGGTIGWAYGKYLVR